ncbi:MAG: hypothetical protein LBT29_09355 [Flavobacteriaceae bacterium]|jgi:hypothetical protein|nr:hypothetical protein [Flavobacteriaceae bacterium]
MDKKVKNLKKLTLVALKSTNGGANGITDGTNLPDTWQCYGGCQASFNSNGNLISMTGAFVYLDR